MYSFNVVLGLLDELLEVKESIKHESEAGEALDLFPYKSLKSEIALNLKLLLL